MDGSVFAQAVGTLRQKCGDTNNQIRFHLFERYDLEESAEKVSYATLASDFGLTKTTVTNQLAAARREFRKILLDKLRETTASDEEFQNQARDLLGVEVR